MMKEPYELNEEELSSVAGGARPQPGERVVTITTTTPNGRSVMTISEARLGEWKDKNPGKIGASEFKHGTWYGPKNIAYD